MTIFKGVGLSQQTFGQHWANVRDVGPMLTKRLDNRLQPIYRTWPNPANTIHRTHAGSMLGQRRRRLANIYPTLVQCLVFAGLHYAPGAVCIVEYEY